MVELIVDEEIKKAYRPVEEPLPEGAELDIEGDFVSKSLDDELREAECAESSENAEPSINELYLEIEYFPSDWEAPKDAPEEMTEPPTVEGIGPKEYFAQAVHEENEVLFVVDLFDKLMCGYGKSWLKPKFLE